MKVSQAVGIDLGTTFSCVSVWEGNCVEVIANDQGNRSTPSVVGFKDTGRLFGDVAKSQAPYNLENSVHNVKRIIGRSYQDVKADLTHWDFKVTKNPKNDQSSIHVRFRGEDHHFAPEKISAMVLGYMKLTAARYLNQDETDKMKCVITVPAYFNHAQRQATKDAATIAGLDALKIINGPTAAALAYGIQPQNNDEKHTDHHVLVYDFGGGTFDVSILHINQGIFIVKPTLGDTHLGGEDIDIKMVDYFVKSIQLKYGIDLSGNVHAKRRLTSACERAKRALSSANEAILDIPSLLNGDDYYAAIIRNTFDEINVDLFESTMKTVKNTLADANLSTASIGEILMVGGGARIPKVRYMLTEFFGKGPSMSVNPDEVVACGVAIHAAVLCGDLDEDDNGRPLTLRDVTPLLLGVKQIGDRMATMIQRNTPIPVKKSTTCVTVEDDQTSILFDIYQGERKKAPENALIGSLTLSGLPPAPRGESEALVTFNLDSDGILMVTAKSMVTGVSKHIEITSGRLSRQDVDEMIAAEAKFKLVNDAFMKRRQARMSLEDYAYKTRFYPMDYQVNKKKCAVNEIVREVFTWIEDHPHAMKEEFEYKTQELDERIKMLK